MPLFDRLIFVFYSWLGLLHYIIVW